MYIKKILFVIAGLGLIAGGVFAYYVYQAVFSPNTKFETETKVLYVPTGATYTELIELISPALKDIYSFDRIARKKGYVEKIKAGRYILKKNLNNNQIINVLRSKNSPVQISFNNQERLENLAGRIASQIEADSLSLLKSFKDEVFLKSKDFSLETALAMYIPNKYEFFWNTSAQQFRERMFKEYNRFWNDSRVLKTKQIGLTKNEVITVASIVQKETAKVDERARVAGVYMNRYKNGWKLDADPTVIYAIKKHRNDWDTVIKRVLYKDLEIDSPYNTYKYMTLPPGPIAMPDISSIDAVLNYEKHEYYFFVADVGNIGYHKFAKTLKQHNNNKKQYVDWINKKGIKR
ncbi:endolytic transglycosylase MltG [Aquimarina muelleri]|uniref:Endolytic murein transglycosylase n=1 Tax=Aquimarina muelleri TaxID=279356 RepID=A0A918N3Q5_9FLAO|nr:endolytic transglycosylase MltG [Aquimarina muelleri]MCX2763372.1 endolytic transglycosylase MltG [Aquimarina muelleri]GGX28600.1 aminodeoxychorismate lyase [Aquimarina muelleri]